MSAHGTILINSIKGALLTLQLALEQRKFTRIILLGSASIFLWPFIAFYFMWVLEWLTLSALDIINSLFGFGKGDPFVSLFKWLITFLFDIAIWVIGYGPIFTYMFLIAIMLVASLGLKRVRAANLKSSVLMLLEQILIFGNLYFLLFLILPPEWKAFGDFTTLGLGLENWVESPMRYFKGWLHTMWLAVLGWVLNSHPTITIKPWLYPFLFLQNVMYLFLTFVVSVHVSNWTKECINKYGRKE